jgi:hypothetical protein
MTEKLGSLMDDRVKGSAPAKAGASAKESSRKQGIMLVVALALLGVAGLVFAYSQGLIFGDNRAAGYTPPSAQEVEQYQQQQKHREEMIKSGTVKPIGG